jgi:hypothetical protein
MSDLAIGAVTEVLGGEYYGGILRGIARVARAEAQRLGHASRGRICVRAS